jgi:Skp family chaperone for outer membrane proteins
VKEFGSLLFKRFEETAKMRYLSVDELSEYSSAVNAETPTEMQTQRIAAIKKASTDRVEEYSRLLGKAEAQVTAADKARLRELNGMEQARPDALQRLSQIYQRNVDAEEQKLKKLAIAEVRQTIGKVAKENGVGEVFDSAALVAAPLDLTPLVLPKVRKAKP